MSFLRQVFLIGIFTLLSCQGHREKTLNIIYEAIPENVAILKCLKHEMEQSSFSDSIKLIPFNLTLTGRTTEELIEIGDSLWKHLRPGCGLETDLVLPRFGIPELYDYPDDASRTDLLSVLEDALRGNPDGSHFHIIAHHVPARRTEPTIYRMIDRKRLTLSLYVPVHTDIPHSRVPAWSRRLVYLGIEPDLVINELDGSGRGIYEALRQAEDERDRTLAPEAPVAEWFQLPAENHYLSLAIEFIIDTREDVNIRRIIIEVLRRIEASYAGFGIPMYFELIFTSDGCWDDLSSWMTHRYSVNEAVRRQDKQLLEGFGHEDEYSVEYRTMRSMDASLKVSEHYDGFSRCMDKMIRNRTVSDRWKSSPADRNLQVYILTKSHGVGGAFTQEYLTSHPAWMPVLPHQNMVQYGILAATRSDRGGFFERVSRASDERSVPVSPCSSEVDCEGNGESVRDISASSGSSLEGECKFGCSPAVEIAAFMRTFMHGVYPAEFRAAPFMYYVEASRQLQGLLSDMSSGFPKVWRSTWEEDMDVKYVRLSVIVSAGNEDVANGGSCLLRGVGKDKPDPDSLMSVIFGDTIMASGSSLEAMYAQQQQLKQAIGKYNCNYKYMREYIDEYLDLKTESEFFNWNYDNDFSNVPRSARSRERGQENWKRLLAGLQSQFALTDGLVVFLTDEAPVLEDTDPSVTEEILTSLQSRDVKLIITTPLFNTAEKIGTPHLRYQWAQFLHQIGLNGALISSSFLPSGHRIWADLVAHYKTIVDVTPQKEGSDPLQLVKALEHCAQFRSMELIPIVQEGAVFGPYGQHLLSAVSTIAFTIERLGFSTASAFIQQMRNETFLAEQLVPQYAPTALGLAQRIYFWHGMRALYRHWNYFITRDDEADNDLHQYLRDSSAFRGTFSHLWSRLPTFPILSHIRGKSTDHNFLIAPLFAGVHPNPEWEGLPNTSLHLLAPQVAYDDQFVMDRYIDVLIKEQRPAYNFHIELLISNFAHLVETLERQITEVCIRR